MILVLLEESRHVDQALDYIRHNKEDSVLSALSSEVIQELDNRGIAYTVPENHVDRKELYQVLQDNYHRVEEFGSEVGNHFENIFRDAGVATANPVYLNFANFKWGFDSFTFAIEDLRAIFKRESPGRVVYFPGKKGLSSDEPIMGLGGREPIYSLLAPLVADALGVEIEGLSQDGWRVAGSYQKQHDGNSKRTVSSPKRWARQAFIPVQGALYLWAWRRWSGPRRTGTGIFLGKSHDLPRICKILRSQSGDALLDGRGLWHPQLRRLILGSKAAEQPLPQAILEDLKSAWRGISEDPSFPARFSHEGVVWHGLVAGWLERFFTCGIREIAEYYRIGTEVIKKYRPDFLLTIHSADHTHAAFSKAFQGAGVPVIYSQEGGNYGYVTNPMNNYADLCLSDYFLAYGAGVAEHFKGHKLTPRQDSAPVPVGSARLEGIKQTAQGFSGLADARNFGSERRTTMRRTTIMYVPASFHHSIVYSYAHSARAYFLMQRRVLEALSEHKSVHVILKLARSGEEMAAPMISYARKMLPHFSILTKPLPTVLDLADAFVIDWSSTVLLEALLTHKPIIVYMDSIVAKPEPAALKLLRRRALVSTEFCEFNNDIRRYLTDPAACLANVDLTNTDFLHAYGYPCQESNVSLRLLEFFNKIKITARANNA